MHVDTLMNWSPFKRVDTRLAAQPCELLSNEVGTRFSALLAKLPDILDTPVRELEELLEADAPMRDPTAW